MRPDVQAIKEEFYRLWVAEDGLVRLEPGILDDHDPYAGRLRTVHNENGQLFLALSLAALWLRGSVDDMDMHQAEAALDRCQVHTWKGLYARAPGRYDRTQSHDNYVGIVLISVLFSTHHLADILHHGYKTGFCFNVVSPERPDLSQTRQPGECAWYELCMGYAPRWLDFIHLMLGLCLNAVHGNASNTNLAWARILALRISLLDRASAASPAQRAVFSLVWGIWTLGIRLRFGGILGSLKAYFRPDHPIIRLMTLKP